MIKRHALVEDRAIKLCWKYHLAMWDDVINLLNSKGFDIKKESKTSYFVNFHEDPKIQAELRVQLMGSIKIDFCNDDSFIDFDEEFHYVNAFVNELYYLDQVKDLENEVIEPRRRD